jgi:hypothetical protein
MHSEASMTGLLYSHQGQRFLYSCTEQADTLNGVQLRHVRSLKTCVYQCTE